MSDRHLIYAPVSCADDVVVSDLHGGSCFSTMFGRTQNGRGSPPPGCSAYICFCHLFNLLTPFHHCGGLCFIEAKVLGQRSPGLSAPWCCDELPDWHRSGRLHFWFLFSEPGSFFTIKRWGFLHRYPPRNGSRQPRPKWRSGISVGLSRLPRL